MREREPLKSGIYTHKEGLTYKVIGIARFCSPSDLIGRSSKLVGTALSVEGYEETHEVSGHQIQVYQLRLDQENPVLRCIKIEEGFDVPDEVVVYEQLEQGEAYPKGTLWWRSEANFRTYFTPVEQ